jgi:hypothetical protein
VSEEATSCTAPSTGYRCIVESIVGSALPNAACFSIASSGSSRTKSWRQYHCRPGVDHAEAWCAVPAAAHGERQVAVARETDRPLDVVGSRTAGDQRRPAVDHPVVHGPRAVVARVVRVDQFAAEFGRRRRSAHVSSSFGRHMPGVTSGGTVVPSEGTCGHRPPTRRGLVHPAGLTATTRSDRPSRRAARQPRSRSTSRPGAAIRRMARLIPVPRVGGHRWHRFC